MSRAGVTPARADSPVAAAHAQAAVVYEGSTLLDKVRAAGVALRRKATVIAFDMTDGDYETSASTLERVAMRPKIWATMGSSWVPQGGGRKAFKEGTVSADVTPQSLLTLFSPMTMPRPNLWSVVVLVLVLILVLLLLLVVARRWRWRKQR